jgi:hypothetical protein
MLVMDIGAWLTLNYWPLSFPGNALEQQCQDEPTSLRSVALLSSERD